MCACVEMREMCACVEVREMCAMLFTKVQRGTCPFLSQQRERETLALWGSVERVRGVEESGEHSCVGRRRWLVSCHRASRLVGAYFECVRMVSLSCGATGMAAWAVEATMLRYQITIVSRTDGSASHEYLQGKVHHCSRVYWTLICSLVSPDMEPLDSRVTAIVMATTDIDLDIAVFGAKILD